MIQYLITFIINLYLIILNLHKIKRLFFKILIVSKNKKH